MALSFHLPTPQFPVMEALMKYLMRSMQALNEQKIDYSTA